MFKNCIKLKPIKIYTYHFSSYVSHWVILNRSNDGDDDGTSDGNGDGMRNGNAEGTLDVAVDGVLDDVLTSRWYTWEYTRWHLPQAHF